MTKLIAIAAFAAMGVYQLVAGDFITGLVMLAFAIFFAVVETPKGKSSGPSAHTSYYDGDSSGGDSGGGD
ncbi:hypothetical protein L1285_23455 [Pseudoalteromonas sp. DL2-H2.2]|uniref:hypothetical protein n=1 Tax=Pseudoalteromonas sp. DL2-H2.2 TaxID=2908889 RepID=UPI001F3ABC7B|nr:hypothetical protein [Pseudoalteromonas sp. DL2-H2.2]MCF2911254.1 hypothetical protein [Pseudoalteromonas sp. DL2-H2.2]